MASQPIVRLLPLLGQVRRVGKGWSARCPAHDDRNNSLSIHQGDDGRVLLKCFAGCRVEEVVGEIGLRLRDLFPPKQLGAKPLRRKTTCPG